MLLFGMMMMVLMDSHNDDIILTMIVGGGGGGFHCLLWERDNQELSEQFIRSPFQLAEAEAKRSTEVKSQKTGKREYN